MSDTRLLGRLHLAEALDPVRARLVEDVTDAWEVVDHGRAMVPTGRRHDEAVEGLRLVLEEVLRPHGLRAEGAVVLEQRDGTLAVVTLRRGRVGCRVLWPGRDREECRVIDLAVRRLERAEVRP